LGYATGEYGYNFRVIFISLSIIFLVIVNSLTLWKICWELLLSVLSTTSSVLDHYLRRINVWRPCFYLPY